MSQVLYPGLERSLTASHSDRTHFQLMQDRSKQLCITENLSAGHGAGNKNKRQGFPGGAVVENLPANAGDTGSSPGLGRSHMPRSN